MSALYSLNHRPIGKTTQPRPFSAAKHVQYIARKQALGHFETMRMPSDPRGVVRWLKQEETQDRKNARVADKVMVALPLALDPPKRLALVREFAEEVTQGKAPWAFAVHDLNKDVQNPHCHILIRDRDPKTGKRAVGMSEKGSTQRLRELWAKLCNKHLAKAGCVERVDHRTLKAQGIDRTPTVHEGPKSRKMLAQGRKLASRPVWVKNSAQAHGERRLIDFAALDRGMSRKSYNEQVRSAGGLYDGPKMDGDEHRANFKARSYDGPDPVVHGMLSTPDQALRFENAKAIFATSLRGQELDKAHHHKELISDEQLKDRLAGNQRNLDAATYILAQSLAGQEAMQAVKQQVQQEDVLRKAQSQVKGSVKAQFYERKAERNATQARIIELEHNKSFFGKRARAEELDKLRYKLAAQNELVQEVSPVDGQRFRSEDQEVKREVQQEHAVASSPTRTASGNETWSTFKARAKQELDSEQAQADAREKLAEKAVLDEKQQTLDKQRALMCRSSDLI